MSYQNAFPGFSHSVDRVIAQIEVKTTEIRLHRSKERKNLTFRFVTPQPRQSEINFWFSAALSMYTCWQDRKVYFNKLASARLRDSESKYSYNRKTLHFPSLTKEKKNKISLPRFSLSAIPFLLIFNSFRTVRSNFSLFLWVQPTIHQLLLITNPKSFSLKH